MLFLELPQGLGFIVCLPADDGGMAALHIDLIHLAVVDLLREREFQPVGFLAKGVPDVFLI